jgi:YesN/AraC family two-component response regulator
MTPINFHSVKTVNATVFNVMFSEKVCNTELLAWCVESRRGLAFSVKKEDRPFFASVLKEICQNAENSLYTTNLINSLLFKSLQYKSKNDATPTSISRAVIHLLRHFREKPSLSDIAAIAGYTPSYFSAIFKKEVGEGFKEYLDRLRFDYAYKLLEHTELNVIQVCKESGFDDYPNFVRRFSKRFSVSPKKVTKYRVK